MQSSGYYIFTCVALLFWSAIGDPSPVAFVSVLDFQLKYLSIRQSVTTVALSHICIASRMRTPHYPYTITTSCKYPRLPYQPYLDLKPRHLPPHDFPSQSNIPTCEISPSGLHVPQHRTKQSCSENFPRGTKSPSVGNRSNPQLGCFRRPRR